MRSALVVATVAIVGCGHDAADHDPTVDAAPGAMLARLEALPGVTVTQAPSGTPGYDYYVLEFTQPVDHADPTGPTFQQEVSLIAVQGGALSLPMIVETDGYWDYTLSSAVELTSMLGAHQISIEHRFFGTSRPAPTSWADCTIEQMAADEHAIVTALAPIFTGPYIATGASKGGMTSTYFRRFYPGDVVATVPYVAPISFGAPDLRYDAEFVDNELGPADGVCRNAVRAAATEMLANRRAALLADAQADAATYGYAYTRVAIGAALEDAIAGVEWAFWQYSGVTACSDVPPTTGSDAAMYAFLEEVSPVESDDDVQVGEFETYVFQASFQLGYPDDPTPYLTPYLMFSGSAYDGELPAGTSPVYDGGSAMTDIQDYVATDGDDLLFVYGQWDPYGGGAYALGSATDAQESFVAEGTHEAEIADLDGSDQDAALARLAAWTGVTPHLPAADRVRRSPPRVPSPAHLRAPLATR